MVRAPNTALPSLTLPFAILGSCVGILSVIAGSGFSRRMAGFESVWGGLIGGVSLALLGALLTRWRNVRNLHFGYRNVVVGAVLLLSIVDAVAISMLARVPWRNAALAAVFIGAATSLAALAVVASARARLAGRPGSLAERSAVRDQWAALLLTSSLLGAPAIWAAAHPCGRAEPSLHSLFFAALAELVCPVLLLVLLVRAIVERKRFVELAPEQLEPSPAGTTPTGSFDVGVGDELWSRGERAQGYRAPARRPVVRGDIEYGLTLVGRGVDLRELAFGASVWASILALVFSAMPRDCERSHHRAPCRASASSCAKQGALSPAETR